MAGGHEVSIDITVKFRGRSIPISMALDSTIEELKYILEGHTKVHPRAQKLIFKGETMEDGKTLKEAEVPNGAKFMLLESQVLQEGGGPILQEAQDIEKNWIKELKITGSVRSEVIYNIKAILDELSTYASYVKILDLSYNSLPNLPIEVGCLSSLLKLDLDGNALLDESVDWEGVVSLKHLEILYMNQNRLTKLPSELGALRSLKQLCLSDNSLSGLPEEIGLLTQLVVLKADHNRLTNLPSELGSLCSLKQLCLSHNNLSGLPEEIGLLTQLVFLKANNNSLTNLPSELGQLCSLKELRLSNNSLSGLPEEIGLLTQLVVLSVYNNRISSIPMSIWSCKSLVQVDLSTNLLKELPEPVSSLIYLEALDLSDNNGLKTVPRTLFKMCQKLQSLPSDNTEITDDVLRQFEGWEGFEERRRKKEQELMDRYK